MRVCGCAVAVVVLVLVDAVRNNGNDSGGEAASLSPVSFTKKMRVFHFKILAFQVSLHII